MFWSAATGTPEFLPCNSPLDFATSSPQFLGRYQFIPRSGAGGKGLLPKWQRRGFREGEAPDEPCFARDV
jgi:hypothetical protein